jgi:hypothetical protein
MNDRITMEARRQAEDYPVENLLFLLRAAVSLW